MKKIRVGLIVSATILILGELAIIDYSNLTESKNLGAYFVITSNPQIKNLD